MARFKAVAKQIGGLWVILWAWGWIAFTFLILPPFRDMWGRIDLFYLNQYIANGGDFEVRFALTMVRLIPAWLFVSMIIIGMAAVYAGLALLVGKKRKRVVAVSGGFDPINGRGHMTHITEAMKLGNWLVVILSRDDQPLMKKKQTFYPSYVDRLLILESIVVGRGEVVMNIDADGSCAQTLRKVRPRIFAKGWKEKDMPYDEDNLPANEIKACKDIGCKIVWGVGDPKTTSSQELVRRHTHSEREK